MAGVDPGSRTGSSFGKQGLTKLGIPPPGIHRQELPLSCGHASPAPAFPVPFACCRAPWSWRAQSERRRSSARHRTVRWQSPLRAIFVRRQAIVRPQMPLQRFKLLSVLETDDVVRRDRLLNRYSRLRHGRGFLDRSPAADTLNRSVDQAYEGGRSATGTGLAVNSIRSDRGKGGGVQSPAIRPAGTSMAGIQSLKILRRDIECRHLERALKLAEMLAQQPAFRSNCSMR